MVLFKCVTWSPGWSQIEVVTVKRDWLVEIGHNPDAARPYCVHYAGNGHYFNSLADAYAYCRGRKWMHAPETTRMDDNILQREGWVYLETIRHGKGRTVTIHRSQRSLHPYCVLNRGRAYLFDSVHEAKAFSHGRGWIGSSRLIYEDGAYAV